MILCLIALPISEIAILRFIWLYAASIFFCSSGEGPAGASPGWFTLTGESAIVLMRGAVVLQPFFSTILK